MVPQLERKNTQSDRILSLIFHFQLAARQVSMFSCKDSFPLKETGHTHTLVIELIVFLQWDFRVTNVPPSLYPCSFTFFFSSKFILLILMPPSFPPPPPRALKLASWKINRDEMVRLASGGEWGKSLLYGLPVLVVHMLTVRDQCVWERAGIRAVNENRGFSSFLQSAQISHESLNWNSWNKGQSCSYRHG